MGWGVEMMEWGVKGVWQGMEGMGCSPNAVTVIVMLERNEATEYDSKTPKIPFAKKILPSPPQ